MNRQVRQPEAHQNYHEVINNIARAEYCTWKEVVASRLCVMPLAGELDADRIFAVLASPGLAPATLTRSRERAVGEAEGGLSGNRFSAAC